MIPKIVNGSCYEDFRGTLYYNNEFDASAVKRFYFIENHCTATVRAWSGHRLEERWFSAVSGSFTIQLIAIDNWELPSKKLEILTFDLQSAKLDVLHVPSGYVTSIQSLEKGSKLMVMADYLFGELEDEYRFTDDYFE